jgi:hypothetical protein
LERTRGKRAPLNKTLDVMTAAEVDALVDASLCGGRTVYTGGITDPERYVADLEAQFRAERITPELRSVFVERAVLNLLPGERRVYFVSDSDPHSVFFDPQTRSFGCAWGPQVSDLKYIDLGFRSVDVLEMLSA